MSRNMLTEGQLRRYRAEGYLTIPGVFAEADLEPVDRYLREHQDVQ